MAENQNVKPKRFYTLENQYNDAPKSMKNEETKRITNQRYFKKDRSEEKKNLTEMASEEKESRKQF